MKNLVSKVLKIGTLISTVGFLGSTVIQVYARFLMASAPSWTEEASRFFFIYAISFAAGLAMKDHSYVHFDSLYSKLSESYRRQLDMITPIAIFILFLTMSVYSMQFIMLGIPEKSPSLGISMSVAFISILIMSLSVSVFALFDIFKNLRKVK